MSGKVKMRCARCGKPFKSAGAKHTLCSECESKERAARAAGKGVVQKSTATPVRTQQPTIVGPGASILVPGLVPKKPLPPASSSEVGEHAEGAESSAVHGPATHQRTWDARVSASFSPPQSRPTGADKVDQPLSHRSAPRAARSDRPPKEARAAAAPVSAFVLSDELRARIEARYQELAQPVEFDGIRTQIASELSIPKLAVKRAVTDLRKRLQLPSWWELQAYTGSAPDLERIRTAYLPTLPVPEVGIHKRLASELGLDPGLVYQGIRRIRAEMHLPQYNPPEAHDTPPLIPSAVAGSTGAD